MADTYFYLATCVIVLTLQQYVSGQITDRWSRFMNDGYILDIDSQYASLLKTLSDLNLQECAQVAALNPLLLWFVYNSGRRECVTSQCLGILTQKQINSDNILYRKHGVSAHQSCSEVKAESPDAEDGEYWLYPDAPTFLGCSTKIYCHNMNTATPSEYLSLPVTNTGAYPNRSNILCNGEVPNTRGRPGTTHFNKIRINIETMTVTVNDYTFATWNGSGKPYGTAHYCYNTAEYPQCGPVGTFHINTERTGLIVSKQQTWRGTSRTAFPPSVTRSADGRQIDLLCGGYCGGCDPEGKLQLHRDPQHVIVIGLCTPACASVLSPIS